MYSGSKAGISNAFRYLENTRTWVIRRFFDWGLQDRESSHLMMVSSVNAFPWTGFPR